MQFVLHVCRVHAMKFIYNKIDEIYKQKDYAVELFRKWVNAFLMGKDLFSFCRRLGDVVVLAGSKTYTEEV
jgi:hypothetical protein